MKSLSVVTNGTGSVMGHFPTSKLQLWRGITNNKWLIDTLEMSYCLQFHHRPPLCTHTWPTVVRQALAISLEVLKQLEKGVIELVNPQIHPGGFHSKYFIKNTCLQERWKFQAHPGPQMPLKHIPFCMLPVIDVLLSKAIKPCKWFTFVNLKDAYFHITIAPHHRRFLLFKFQGRTYQYRVLPFGLSLYTCVFTQCI